MIVQYNFIYNINLFSTSIEILWGEGVLTANRVGKR